MTIAKTKNNRRITIRDVADAADVSVATASYVLRGVHRERRIRDEVAVTLRATAKRLGYTPHWGARSLVTGRAACIGFIREQNAWWFNELVSGVSDELSHHSMHLTTAPVAPELFTDSAQIRQKMIEWTAQGVLVYHFGLITAAMQRAFADYSAIWINNDLAANCVRPDDFGGAAQAYQHLFALGHRRIAYLDSLLRDQQQGHYSSRHRLNGYRAAAQAAGGESETYALNDIAAGGERMEFCRGLLRRADRPTAFVVNGLVNADVLLMTALAMGLRVPADVSIMLIGEKRISATGLSFDAMKVPLKTVGQQAVKALLELLENSASTRAPEILPLEYLAGQTAAPLGG